MAYLGNDLQVAFPTYRNIDDISGSFNGVTTSFPLTVAGVAPIPAPINSQQCLISVNGVVQRPDDSGAEGFRLSGGNIIFASAPAGGVDFFGVILAGADYVNIGANFPSGTAVAPSITFDSDLDTGIYNPAGNQIGFTTSGVQRLVINSSGQISGGLGTAAAPVISFISDPNTGIYSPGADQVAISTGGSGRLFVDASGNVGVGLTSPASRFHIYDSVAVLTVEGASTSSASLQFKTNSNNRFKISTPDSSADLVFYSSGSTERLRITSAGLVGIGTSSPESALDVRSASISQIIAGLSGGQKAVIGSDTSTGAYVGTLDNYDIKLITNSTVKAVVTSAGNVGIGTASPNGTLDINNGAAVFSNSGTYIGGIGRANGLIGGTTSELAITTSAAQGLLFGINNTERARIDSSGRLLVGTSSARSNFFNTTSISGLFQIEGTTNLTRAFSQTHNAADDTGSIHILAKSRGASVGSNTLVSANDQIGVVSFQAADGTDLVAAASIEAFVDGTPGANDMPGRIVLSTTADGASSPTERMRIDSSGRVGIGTTDPKGTLRLAGSSANSFPNNGALLWLTDTNAATDYKNWSVSSINGDYGVARASDAFNTAQNAYKITGAATQGYVGEHIWYTNNSSEKVRIDNSGRLLVGTSTSNGSFNSRVQIAGSTFETASQAISRFEASASGAGLYLVKSRNGTVGSNTIVQNGDTLGTVQYYGADGNGYSLGASIDAVVDGTPGAGDLPSRLVFSTTADGASSPTERMRIDNAGSLIYGTSTSPGADITSGTGFYYQISTGLFYVRSNGSPVAAFNRGGDDGTLVEFKQDQTTEGTISVSGTTVSYNGAHLSRWSQLPFGQERTEILRGSVLSNIDEMCEWGEEDNEQLNRMKVSDVEGDKNVSGVFQAWDDDDDTYTNDFYCAMTGDFIIRIAGDVTVERGDLLMSAGDGTAKPQDDDIIRSKTIAKVTSTNVSCTYPDGSYCVPCVLMAC